MFKLHGIIPAMATPFNEDFSINEKVLRQEIEFYIENGCHAIGIGGSAGEYSRMTLEERQLLIDIAVDAAKGRTGVIVGTGCHSTQETVALTQYAERAGADAALVITPYYVKIQDEAMIEYYKTVAASTKIGIIVYNWPEATNVVINPKVVEALCDVENIVGIKNSHAQEHTNLLIKLTENAENFNVITGEETFLLPTLACGGHGIYGLAQNVIPAQMVAIYDAVMKEKDIDKAQRIHKKYLPLFDLMIKEPSPAPLRAALELLGFEVGAPRLPLKPATAELKAEIKAFMEWAGVLKDGKYCKEQL